MDGVCCTNKDTDLHSEKLRCFPQVTKTKLHDWRLCASLLWFSNGLWELCTSVLWLDVMQSVTANGAVFAEFIWLASLSLKFLMSGVTTSVTSLLFSYCLGSDFSLFKQTALCNTAWMLRLSENVRKAFPHRFPECLFWTTMKYFYSTTCSIELSQPAKTKNVMYLSLCLFHNIPVRKPRSLLRT